MRRPREVKEATHVVIVAQASRLFRERGVEGTSVGEVMAEAGLTHGGFYRHFETKEALVAAAIRAMFEGIAATIDERAAAVGARTAVGDYFDYYLSNEHLTHPGLGCPVPSLGSEIGRASEALKAEFGASLNNALSALAKGSPGTEAEQRAAATRELALRVGAMVMARACDPETAKAVLEACRRKPPAKKKAKR